MKILVLNVFFSVPSLMTLAQASHSCAEMAQYRRLFIAHLSLHRELCLHVNVAQPGADKEDSEARKHNGRSDKCDGD